MKTVNLGKGCGIAEAHTMKSAAAAAERTRIRLHESRHEGRRVILAPAIGLVVLQWLLRLVRRLALGVAFGAIVVARGAARLLEGHGARRLKHERRLL